MKRILLGVFACLLLGTAINLAVAWTLALGVDPRTAPVMEAEDLGLSSSVNAALPRFVPPNQPWRETFDRQRIASLADRMLGGEPADREAARRGLETLAASGHPAAADLASTALESDDLAWAVSAGPISRDDTRPGRPLVSILRLNVAADEDFLKRLTPFPHLEHLSLGAAVDDDLLATAPPLAQVRSLDLRGARIVGDGLQHLASWPKLARISLAGCAELTDDGLAHLARVTTLEEVDLSKCRSVTARGLAHLATLPALRSLTLASGGLDDDDLDTLVGFPALRSVSLEANAISDVGLDRLTALSSLERLDMRHTSITDEGLRHLVRLPRLTSLDLGATSITDAGLSTVAQIESLERLSVAHTQITNDGLRALSPLSGLRELNIDGTRADPLDLDVLGPFPELRRLQVMRGMIEFPDLLELLDRFPELDADLAIYDAGFGGLDLARDLFSLNLFGEAIGDHDLAVLAALPRLETLDLRGTRVTDEGLEHAGGLHRLRELRLPAGVTDAGLAHLGASRELRRVEIGDAAVTWAGLHDLLVTRQGRGIGDVLETAYLRNPWPDWHHPLESHLGTSAITEAHMADLAKSAVAPRLEALLLDRAPASSDRTATVVASLPRLAVLWMSGDAVTGRTLEALRGNETLSVLWLPDTKIGNDDLAPLSTLPRLRILNLAGTAIDDDAVAVLGSLEGLEVLVVRNGVLSPGGLASVAGAGTGRIVLESQATPLARVFGLDRWPPRRIPAGCELTSRSSAIDERLEAWFGPEHLEVVKSLDARGFDAKQLAEVAGLTSLRNLVLDRDLPAEAIAELRAALQSCRIDLR